MRISDWSSDVCSSDLLWICPYSAGQINTLGGIVSLVSMTGFARVDGRAAGKSWIWELKSVHGRGREKIGREACRERAGADVETSGVAESRKKNKPHGK